MESEKIDVADAIRSLRRAASSIEDIYILAQRLAAVSWERDAAARREQGLREALTPEAVDDFVRRHSLEPRYAVRDFADHLRAALNTIPGAGGQGEGAGKGGGG